jgi:serine/threonine protein kinase
MAESLETAKTQAAPEADDPFGWIGHSLEGKYAIEEVVGEGGFAVVYRAHHKGLDDRIAVKCLKIPKKLAGEDRERFLQSFLDEGKLLHRLSRADAGIVQALDVGAAVSPNGSWTPFLVLEWLEGHTLEEDLRARARAGERPRTLAEAIALLEPAARALQTAHAQGVCHRDVKPANLYLATVAGKRVLKVVDFGIAKVIGESVDLQRAHEATGLSLHAFTPRYGAPEQFDRRFGATGPWTDVFALALIVVELVIGKSALSGDSAQLFVAAANPQHRPTLRAFGIDEGDAVEAVLLRALAVDPKERHGSAGELWDALLHASASADTVLSLSSPPPMRPSPDTPLTIDPSRLPVKSAQRTLMEPEAAPRQGSMWPWLGLGLTTLAAVCAGGYALTRTSEGPRGTTTPSASVTGSTAATTVDSAASTSAASVPPPVTIACSQGLAPHVDTSIGFSLCIPSEFADKPATDGVVRAGDLELTLRGGYLRPPEITLQRMFEKDSASSLDRDGIWLLPSETKKDDASYFITGTRQNKPFAKRVAITTDRFASFDITYPAAQKKLIEAKLDHMVPTFTALTRP